MRNEFLIKGISECTMNVSGRQKVQTNPCSKQNPVPSKNCSLGIIQALMFSRLLHYNFVSPRYRHFNTILALST